MNDITTQNQSAQPSTLAPDAGLATSYEQAKMYPRDMKQSLSRALQELELVPELAEKSYYSIPYKEGGGRHMVEGLSIKASMVLARWWGNIATDARVVSEDKSNFYVRGACIDLETNFPNATEVRVSKYYKPKNSQGVVPWPSDMMRNQVLSGMSKAKRNAVLQIIPEYIKDAYFQRAKELVINPIKRDNRPIESLQVRIMNGKNAISQKFGIKGAELDEYMEEVCDGLDEGSFFANLTGIFNALKEGSLKADDIRKGKRAPFMPQEKK